MERETSAGSMSCFSSSAHASDGRFLLCSVARECACSWILEDCTGSARLEAPPLLGLAPSSFVRLSWERVDTGGTDALPVSIFGAS
eukprot:807682-Rhodomonas_salina.1